MTIKCTFRAYRNFVTGEQKFFRSYTKGQYDGDNWIVDDSGFYQPLPYRIFVTVKR